MTVSNWADEALDDEDDIVELLASDTVFAGNQEGWRNVRKFGSDNDEAKPESPATCLLQLLAAGTSILGLPAGPG